MNNQSQSRSPLRISARLRLYLRVMAKQLGVSSRSIRIFVSAALFSVFSNLVFIPLLSLALFVVYMAHYGFFSYDFFAEGLFGMKLFVLAMVVSLVVISLSLFGSGILIYARRNGAAISRGVFRTAVAINILFLLFVIISLFYSKDIGFGLLVLAVTFYLACHFGVFFFACIKKKLLLLAILFLIVFGLIATQPALSIQLLEIGLRTFGVGGKIKIEVVSEDGLVNAELILITPKYVYFVEENSGVLAFQALDKVKKIRHLVQKKT